MTKLQTVIAVILLIITITIPVHSIFFYESPKQKREAIIKQQQIEINQPQLRKTEIEIPVQDSSFYLTGFAAYAFIAVSFISLLVLIVNKIID